MSKVGTGDTVRVHYSCMLEDGTLIDDSRNGAPLQFILGQGHVIPGFEEAILEMDLNEEKTLKVPMEKAFGPHKEENIVVVKRENFPGNLKLEVGQQLQLQLTDGTPRIVSVIDLTDNIVTLDTNHPLSGKDLIFDIKLLEIV